MYEISSKLIPGKLDEKSRREISQRIKSYRALDSTVMYVLALLKTERLPADDLKLHTAFFELKKEFPDFFEELTFSKGDIYPFSQELESILFRLQQSSFLGSLNPTYEFFILTRTRRITVLKNLTKRFTKDERIELAKMGKRLRSLLIIKSRSS